MSRILQIIGFLFLFLFSPKGSNVCALWIQHCYWASLSYNVIPYVNLRDKQWFFFFFFGRGSGAVT